MYISIYICISTILSITVRVIVPSVIFFSVYPICVFFLYVHLMMKKKNSSITASFCLVNLCKNFYLTIVFFCLCIYMYNNKYLGWVRFLFVSFFPSIAFSVYSIIFLPYVCVCVRACLLFIRKKTNLEER